MATEKKQEKLLEAATSLTAAQPQAAPAAQSSAAAQRIAAAAAALSAADLTGTGAQGAQGLIRAGLSAAEDLFSAAQSGPSSGSGASRYSTANLTSRAAVENALAGAQYQQSQAVTDAANALKEWQNSRPADYESAYQGRIDALLEQLLARESFQYSYAQDPLYRQYAQAYTQNAYNASADAAAQAAALTGGYGSSYAVSAAQQAYQQQIGLLNSVIPTLYSLALDTYTSGGDAMESKLDALNTSEQNAQDRYEAQLADYYTQLEQKGEAYNTAYTQDYTAYLNYLSQLDTLRGYYAEQEQAEAARRQQVFSNVITVLGVIGDVVQLAISGTTGLGSLAGSLLNTGYNIYADSRDYEADRADTAWSQQMAELQRQDSLTQQAYENESAEREYQATLAQQAYNNSVTSEKLALAKSKWAQKQTQAEKAASTASTAASRSAASLAATSSTGATALPYTAVRMHSQGKTDREIRAALAADGYSGTQISRILEQLNGG